MVGENTKAKRAGEKTMAKWKNIDLLPLVEVELKPLERITTCLANISWKIFKDTDFAFHRYGFKKLQSRVVSPVPVIMTLANLHVMLTGKLDEELRKALFGDVADRQAELRCHEWLLFAYSQLVTTAKNCRVLPVSRLFIKGYSMPEMENDLLDVFYRYSRDAKVLLPMESFDDVEVQLNDEIRKKSGSHMRRAVPPGYVRPDWNLFIATALQFKGVWLNLETNGRLQSCPFTYSFSGFRNFRTTFVSCITGRVRADFGSYKNFTVCSFEFRWSYLTAYFFKPSSRYNMDTLMWDLTGDKILTVIREISRQRFTKNHLVDVQIPLFTLETEGDLLQILNYSKDIMSLQSNNLPIATGSEESIDYKLSGIYQKVNFQVGPESSNMKNMLKQAPINVSPHDRSQPEEFFLDCPFLFVVYEVRLGLILLIGRVMDPSVMVLSPEQPYSGLPSGIA